jgi:putative membrane protein
MQTTAITSGVYCLAMFALASIAFAAPSSNPDKQFLILAAKTDMTEAHEGQMAEAKAWRADVKSLAKPLVQEHTESYEHLTELATKTGATIPKGIDTAKDPIVKQLSRLKGASFDYQFVRDEVAANRMATAAFKQEAAHGKDAEVKAYANRMIPILSKELHLTEECVRPAPPHLIRRLADLSSAGVGLAGTTLAPLPPMGELYWCSTRPVYEGSPLVLRVNSTGAGQLCPC